MHRHFTLGCSVAGALILLMWPRPCGAESLRIGVFGLFRPKELILRPVPGGVILLAANQESLVLEGAESATLRLNGNWIEYRVARRVGVTSIIRAGGRGHAAGELLLSVPGKIERHFRGQLEVVPGPGMLRPVIAMDREDAVASVVAAESPPGAPIEALKAQAVTARSYFCASRRRHQGFDFCDTTHCQFLREPPEPSRKTFAATEATRGLVLAYEGRVFPTLFSASCGGRTRTLAQVGLRSDGYPYFSVECTFCLTHAPLWKSRLDVTEVTPALANESNEHDRLQIGRRKGWNVIPGNNFNLRNEGQTVVINGRGAGHGLGLCQQGAAAMALAGAPYSKILHHYYPNTTLTGLH